MSETWLHTNRRALALALVLPVVGLLCGLLLLAASPRVGAWAWWLDIVMTGLWTVLSAMLLSMLRKPRIARRGDQMLFYLRLRRTVSRAAGIGRRFPARAGGQLFAANRSPALCKFRPS